MKHPKAWSRFFLVAALITAALIFYFSAQKRDDSASLSGQITLRVISFFRPDFQQLGKADQRSYFELLNTVIRKNAHFCEFMLLGFNLMAWARLRDLSMPVSGCRRRAWGIATLYAATDELHQLFVSERAAAVTDVLIDSAGSLAGTFVATLGLAMLAALLKRRGRYLS